jgi:hypothetical protein
MLGKLFRRRTTRKSSRKPEANRFRPQLEALEVRAVPTTLLWTGAATPPGQIGDFNDPQNWIDPATHQAVVPQQGDDAIIQDPNQVVMMTQSTTVNSLNFPGLLVVANGGLIVTNVQTSTFIGGLDLQPGTSLEAVNSTGNTFLGRQGLGIMVENGATLATADGVTTMNSSCNVSGNLLVMLESELVLSGNQFYRINTDAAVSGGGLITIDVQATLQSAVPLDQVQVRDLRTDMSPYTPWPAGGGWVQNPDGTSSRDGIIYQPGPPDPVTGQRPPPVAVGTVHEDKASATDPATGITTTVIERTEKDNTGAVVRRTRRVIVDDPGPPHTISVTGYTWDGTAWVPGASASSTW